MVLRSTSASLAALAVLGLVFILSSPAGAAGFALFGQGGRGMGFAGAYTAQASDPSAIFHNAAGLGFLKGKQIYVGGTLIHSSTDFTGADPFPGAGRLESMSVGLTPTPAVYYSQKISDYLVAGVGVHTPFRLETEWASPETFTGRFLSQRANFKGFSINPAVAYQLADRFSVGGGLDIRISSISLLRNVPRVNPFTLKVIDVASIELASGNHTGFGWNVGALAKPTESLSLGVSYRHKVKQDYTATATFTRIPTGNSQLDGLFGTQLPAGNVEATTSIEYPSILSLGVAYSWYDWTLEGDVNFYGWSSFASLPLTLVGHPELSSVLEENYKDSRQYRVGLERLINDIWAVRGGYFYDETPSPPEAVSPMLPDASRHGFCLGGSWTSGRWRVDASAWYVRLKERSTEGLERDNYNGTYKGNAKSLGVSFGYVF